MSVSEADLSRWLMMKLLARMAKKDRGGAKVKWQLLLMLFDAGSADIEIMQRGLSLTECATQVDSIQHTGFAYDISGMELVDVGEHVPLCAPDDIDF